MYENNAIPKEAKNAEGLKICGMQIHVYKQNWPIVFIHCSLFTD